MELSNKNKLPKRAKEDAMGVLQIQCPEWRRHIGNQVITVEVSPNADLRGLLTCRDHEDTKIPVAFVGGYAASTSPTLPTNESHRLQGVPEDIVQDIEEAEECHFNQTYKAASVMCRRALQLAYEHFLSSELLKQEWKGKQPTLGALIGIARGLGDNDLSSRAIILTETINNLGNDGAHHRVHIDPSDVASAIHDAVVVVNEIYQKKPASQSEPSNNVL